MRIDQVLKSLFIVALFASGATWGGDSAVRVSNEQGKPVAQFNIGDSRCVLKDDLVRCTRISK
ncbi:MAG TPA: hypothetical protein VMH26_02785 [Burkholderiales bacterium]|nr:hypothetical protein [Burkholderiales bacterium]